MTGLTQGFLIAIEDNHGQSHSRRKRLGETTKANIVNGNTTARREPLEMKKKQEIVLRQATHVVFILGGLRQPVVACLAYDIPAPDHASRHAPIHPLCHRMLFDL